jgi:hypothetical protein
VDAPVEIDPSCASFFIRPASADYSSRSSHKWTLYGIDAVVIAATHSIPTLNGYSAWAPPDWDLLNPEEDVYAGRVRTMKPSSLRPAASGFRLPASPNESMTHDEENDLGRTRQMGSIWAVAGDRKPGRSPVAVSRQPHDDVVLEAKEGRGVGGLDASGIGVGGNDLPAHVPDGLQRAVEDLGCRHFKDERLDVRIMLALLLRHLLRIIQRIS